MSKWSLQDMHRKRKRRNRNAAQLAAQLAPLEEQKNASTQERGAIVVGNETPSGFRGVEDENDTRSFRIEPVVLVILMLMLAYIAFIAWQVSKMPGIELHWITAVTSISPIFFFSSNLPIR